MTKTKNYDSAFCGSLPLQHINLIQSYGYLLILKKEDFSIIQVSENLEEIFHLTPHQIINTSLSDYIQRNELDNLQKKISSGITENLPFSFTIYHSDQCQELKALVNAKNEYLIIELEKFTGAEADFTSVFREVKYAMALINHAQTLQTVLQTSVEEIKRLSGFDSVLLYQFDEEWNGTVVAEVKEDDMQGYMGLKFPASDIPRQVRELYMRNPYRMIPDRNYTPVKLYPLLNPATNSFTDLSSGNLRAVATVHLEYMKNMGLEASMSLRIIVRNRLWGILSCHHRSSRKPDFETRSVLELLSSIVSGKIEAALDKAAFESISELNEKRSRLVDYIYSENNWVEAVLRHEINLKDLLKTDGMIIIYKGKIQTLGTVPVMDDIESLVYWLQAKDVSQIYTSSHLMSVNEYAVAYQDIGSGIIVIPLNKEQGEYIIGFRQEVIRHVNWGGNPDEALVFEADQKSYHPRNSFKVWKEVVKNTSIPWTEAEIKVAESFRNYVFEYLSKKSISSA